MARARGRESGPVATLLVATDFSPGARRAQRRALLLPTVADPTIHLVHVVGAPAPGAREGARLADAERRLATAAARMRRLARALGGAEPEIVPSVLVGAPHVEIIRRSRLAGADLILVGRHGRRALQDLVLGTTAARVVRLGDTPVLVVNGKPAGPYRRPLVGVGLEDASGPLVALAARLVAPDAAPLTLLHAHRPPAMGRLISSAGSARERAEDRRVGGRSAAARMKALVAALADRHPGIALRPLIFHGDPRRLLLSQAARARTDLIALGTHGRTGVAHVLLGSVAEDVVAASRCDVLVARPARFTFELP